jgi:hypothetical protein
MQVSPADVDRKNAHGYHSGIVAKLRAPFKAVTPPYLRFPCGPRLA